MISTPQQVLDELTQRKFRPVYFFYGEENYYIDTITDYIADKVLLDSEKPFNLTIVYGKDQDIAQILGYARRYPIAAERQVVIVKEAQDLLGLHNQAGQKLLFNYLQAPNPATLLVFNYKYKNLDARTILSKHLSQDAVVVHAKKLYDNQIPAWINDYLRKKKLKIEEKACLMLQEMVGNDLARLAKELDKVLLNLQQEDTILDSTIQTYVGVSKQFNAFELQRALATKNIYKANQIVFYWATKHSKNNAALPVIALVFNFFTKLLVIHQTMEKDKQTLAKLLGINPYFLQEYLTAAQHYSLAQVIANIEHLYQADLQLKGVDYPAVTEEKILKELVFKLMHS
jgi:DNA polymerase-3 subunit delta